MDADKSFRIRKANPGKPTLFDCNPGMVVFDEAADYRNPGVRLDSARALGSVVKTNVLLTATPLITRSSVSSAPARIWVPLLIRAGHCRTSLT